MATNIAVSGRSQRYHQLTKALFYLGVALIVLFCVAPLLYVIDEALKPTRDLQASPPTLLPSSISFDSFPRAFSDHAGFSSNIKNSAIIAGTSTLIALIFGASAAYAIARLRFKGRATVLTVILGVNLFPAIALIGPLYIFFYNRGWIDTYQALIIPNVVFTLPLTIWILTTFFRELPKELEESAKVDGAGLLSTFFLVVLPLTAPGIFTAAILAFINAWNEYLFAVSFTTNGSVQPVTVGLANFSGGANFYVPWGEIAAGAVIVTLPLIVLVLILQRRIVSGLTAGAVKG